MEQRLTGHKRGVGDCIRAYRHESNNLWFSSWREAQDLSDRICEEAKIARWSITFTGKNTKRLMGKAFRSSREIQLHSIGQNVSVLLHEIAHEKGRRHDWEFKQFQNSLLLLWDGIKGECRIKDKTNPVKKSVEVIDDETIQDLVQFLIEDHEVEMISRIGIRQHMRKATIPMINLERVVDALKDWGVSIINMSTY